MENMKRPANMKMTLKTARELLKMTQSDAAQRIGVSTDTLGNYERGRYYPDIPTLRKIEEVYHVHYDQLIFLPIDFGLNENKGEKQDTESTDET